SMGNLFISAMVGVTGSFESGLEESSRVLAVRGRVVPSTLEAVVLAADIDIGEETPIRVYGESQIPQAKGRILRVLLEPSDPRAYPGALQAILSADLIVVGPGSLYTSILPNLLVPEITRALQASRAPKLYICNVATQPGETEHYTAEHHLKALEVHLGRDLFDTIVLNIGQPRRELPESVEWVKPEIQSRQALQVVKADLMCEDNPWRHDPDKLAATVMDILS
ncbi:MAG: gluconeogenesis factor YvcK family protein, partial [Anaerolineae bacterium]